MITQKYINDLSYKIIGCAIEVNKQLGHGLLEFLYEKCFIEELLSNDLRVKSQVLLPVSYKGKELLDSYLKIDIIVDDLIIVENKAVETIIPLYKAQLLTYLKLTGLPKGLLINFNCENIKNQIVSLVTDNYAKLSL